MQRRIQRSGLETEDVARELRNTFTDSPAVHGRRFQGLENEHVESALEHVLWFAIHSWVELISYCRIHTGQKIRKPPSTIGRFPGC